MKYTFVDPRTGNHVYRHALPDGSKFVRSFKTTDPKVAESQWSTVDAEYRAKAQDQKITQQYRENKDLRRDKFWSAVGRFVMAMRASHGGILPRPPRVELPTETRFTGHPFNYVRNAFLTWAEHNDPDAVKVFEMGDMRQERLFHLGLIGAYFTISEMERLPGLIEPVQPPALPAPAPSDTDHHSLQDLYERWVKETDPAQSTQDDVKRAMGLFEEANPDKPAVEQINRKHIQNLRELLASRDISNQTRNKRIAGISLLMGQAIREFWIGLNPTIGVKFEVKDGDRTKRDAFERDDIKAWMKHPVFSEHRFETYGWSEFWIPLLSIWHGARRNEIGHLLTTDLKQIDGMWTLNIDGKVGGGNGKKLKNTASRRMIPLHPVLVKLGFPEWVRTLSPGRMFANCPIEGNGSIGCISKFVRTQLDASGVDAALSLHCSRHTYREFARDIEPSIPEEITDAIVGHSDGKQGRRYGSVPLRAMARALAKIDLGAMPKPYAG